MTDFDRPPSGATPLTLTPDAIGPLDPVIVQAWIPWSDGRSYPQLVAVIQRTERAARVGWTDENGHQHEVWIWANAIQP